MFHVPEKHRLKDYFVKSSGNNGVFRVPYHRKWNRSIFDLVIVATDGEGWEHVSVSLMHRCPTWNEMNYIKNLFWDEEDLVIQYHPAKSQYVDYHKYCLHMWRPNNGTKIPVPNRKLI